MIMIRRLPGKPDRGALAASLAVTLVLASPVIGVSLDSFFMNNQYEQYVASIKESEGSILSYHAYVDKYRKEHPIVGRFYGIGRNK